MNEIGITSFGVYIPYYFIKRETIGAAWGDRGQRGVRSLANADEDSITMAVEAARKCTLFMPHQDIGELYFASTTCPYSEKSAASIIATACDFPKDTFVSDFGTSLKCGTNALKAALDSVRYTRRNALVTTADCRNAYPKSAEEQLFGDAGAAVAVGTEGVLATFDGFSGINSEITDVWVNTGEKFINTAEKRFRIEKGYLSSLKSVISDLLKKYELAPENIAKVVLPTPTIRDHEKLAKSLGFVPEQLQSAFLPDVGICGCAQPIFLLACAIAQAEPGDKILMASYGQGADAFLFTVTNEVQVLSKDMRQDCKRQLKNRRELRDYGRFLSFRGIINALPGEPFKIPASTSMYWREQNTYLRLKYSRCNNCGAEIFPVHRVCAKCRTKDDFTLVSLSGQHTKLFTYSIDKLAGRSDDPVIVQAVAETESGVRVYLNMTDFDQEEVEIGMELEFTFRKINTLGNFNNYYWKFKPCRN